MLHRIQTIINSCLRRIFKIKRQDKIRNEELWERADQEPMDRQICKYDWMGHTVR